MSKRAIILATQNPGKVQELSALLADLDAQLKVLPAPAAFDVEETGSTFAENARLKALGLARLWPELGDPQLPAAEAWFLADDSGLVVDALGGEPGVLSARWGGLSDPEARNQLLLARMLGVPDEQRSARFVCHLALADDQEVRFEAEGVCPGSIAFTPRGEHGFGYDPLFRLPGRRQTMAELPLEEKNRISHRALALKQLRGFLAELQHAR